MPQLYSYKALTVPLSSTELARKGMCPSRARSTTKSAISASADLISLSGHQRALCASRADLRVIARAFDGLAQRAAAFQIFDGARQIAFFLDADLDGACARNAVRHRHGVLERARG